MLYFGHKGVETKVILNDIDVLTKVIHGLESVFKRSLDFNWLELKAEKILGLRKLFKS